MIQHNQVGKYRKKEDVLNAKVGHTYVLGSRKSYEFTEWRKEGRKYIFVITYKGIRCQLKESDYNTMDLDKFLEQMEQEQIKIESGFYNQ